MTKTIKFKKGDRVVHKKFGAGRVLDCDPISFLVEFDKKDTDFHDGSGLGKPYHCWWCLPRTLSTETKKYKFSVGDKVRDRFGMEGVIDKVDKSYDTVLPYYVNYPDKGYHLWEKEKDLTKIDGYVKYAPIAEKWQPYKDLYLSGTDKQQLYMALYGGNIFNNSNKHVYILGVYNKETLRVLRTYKRKEDAEKKQKEYQDEFGDDYKFVVLKEKIYE